MNAEIKTIIQQLDTVNEGEPWFGRSVYEILSEVDESTVYTKPNDTEHSLIELLYHMLTWTEFTLRRLEKDTTQDLATFESLDWRDIDPEQHTWEKGMSAFKKTNKAITDLLIKKEDAFLNEQVDYRKYNYRFLLNGMIQHHIYHLGQVAYLKKLLDH